MFVILELVGLVFLFNYRVYPYLDQPWFCTVLFISVINKTLRSFGLINIISFEKLDVFKLK